ncbi:hypothetical protein AALA00_13530 [Lachnospiraceae bacterium 46-15]
MKTFRKHWKIEKGSACSRAKEQKLAALATVSNNVTYIWRNGKVKEVVVVEKKKMGRPTDSPKTITKRARMSEEDVDKLRLCCQSLDKSESDIIRMGISEVYTKIINKES